MNAVAFLTAPSDESRGEVSAPAPAPASSKGTVFGKGPNIDAMKSATGEAVRNCPNSSCLFLGFAVTAGFMSLRYQIECRFTTEQNGVHEVGLDEFLPDVALASQALRISGPHRR